ncbi:transposase [Desulforhopalus vacuolatus]|nr:transposase [Desulforhopalus vacuolatus]
MLEEVSQLYYIWLIKNNNDIRRGRQCVFRMHVHLVFATKYCRGVFTDKIIEDLCSIFAKVCTDFEAGDIKKRLWVP